MAEELREKYAMTLRRIKNICIERDGYEAPHLNDVLELQYKGFGKIENLHHYHNVHALFLEQNSIRVIEGLDRLTKLKCLYLSKNRIEKIENLSHLHNLCHLDLSHNPITKVEGLGECKSLELIKLAHCRIEKLEGLEGLGECQSINSVDVTHNQIDATDEVPEFWGRIMPDLQCLYYNGNPGLRTIKQYRRRLIGQLKSLKFLDERPVFEDDRAYAEAWCKGGQEEEKKVRQVYQENKAKQEEEDRKTDLAWREKAVAMYDSLPKTLPTVNSTGSQNFAELWEDLKTDRIIEVPASVAVPAEPNEQEQPQESSQQEDQAYDFEPPARVEEVLGKEGSWEMLESRNSAPPGPPSESGASLSQHSEPPSELSSQQSSQLPVRSEAPTIPSQIRSNAPSTNADSVVPPWMWSNIRDRRLQSLAALHGHVWARAAATLSHEFGDVVSEEACRKRYGMLIRGNAPVLDAALQERDMSFYYRRQAALNINAVPANVNEGLMAALAQQEGIQDPPEPSASASDLEQETPKEDVEKESSETAPGIFGKDIVAEDKLIELLTELSKNMGETPIVPVEESKVPAEESKEEEKNVNSQQFFDVDELD